MAFVQAQVAEHLSESDKSESDKDANPWRVCVAPMLDWTDRHCRYFHRLFSKRTRLYTEMVNAHAIVYGDTKRYLYYNDEEHPLALQLGGNKPALLAQAAKLAEEYGYDEINLNCGCPSERVQSGRFGVCLMRTPKLVADCLKAMQDVVGIPVTVKHRIGIDKDEAYTLVQDFVGTLADAGCRVFIVHARNAWLKGLSPRENRSIPPLRYAVAYQLKHDFPACNIVINGGIQNNSAISEHLQHVDGVMIGRQAYQNPWIMQAWDALFWAKVSPHQTPAASSKPPLDRARIEMQMLAYMERESVRHQIPWPSIARHMLGLYRGECRARSWRRVWSAPRLKALPPKAVMLQAQAALMPGEEGCEILAATGAFQQS